MILVLLLLAGLAGCSQPADPYAQIDVHDNTYISDSGDAVYSFRRTTAQAMYSDTACYEVRVVTEGPQAEWCRDYCGGRGWVFYSIGSCLCSP